MCYHNSATKKAKQLAQRYNVQLPPNLEFDGIYHASAFTHPYWPVISSNKPGELSLMSWGLVPAWVQSVEQAKEIRNNTPNARYETIFEKPAFRNAAGHGRRVLIPSTGFFEWKEVNKKKYPHFIRLKNEEVFSMAGIFDECVDKQTGEVYQTFSVLTTEANTLMADIHNTKKRMPLILPREREKEWLERPFTREFYDEFKAPFPDGEMEAHTISRLITAKGSNTNVPEITNPFIYPELTDQQINLF